MTLFQVLSIGCVLPFSILGGLLAHRIQRLKPFVLGGAVIMAIGLGILAVVPSWDAALWAATVFGCGFGLYLGSDIALAIRVLPTRDGSGKDLGVFYTSIFVPLILSPIIGASILNASGNNYEVLFLVAGLSSVLAAVLILPITSVH